MRPKPCAKQEEEVTEMKMERMRRDEKRRHNEDECKSKRGRADR